MSVLACGGGVSFRFCCTCGARCRSGSLWGLFVSGTCGVRLRFGFFSVSFRLRGAGVAPSVWRGACRCSARSVSLRRRSAPARTIGDHLRSISAGQRCCCEHSTGHRDHRAALSPRSGRVFFAQRCHRHSSWGHTRPAWFSQGNGPVQPGFGCPRQGALGRPPRHDVLPSPACSTQPGTNLAGGNRLVPLQRSWGLEHPRQGQHLPGRGLPPQVRASLLPQALTRRTFSRCRTHHC